MNKGVDSMNKIMEMYSPSHKKRVMAEVVEGYAQNGKGGSPRLALKGLFEGKKTLPKKVDVETFEKYGFNAEQTIAAFHAEQVGEPLPESPLEDAPPTVPFPQEPSNANFSAEYETMDATFSCPECGCRGCYGCMGEDEGQSCNSCGYVFEDGPTGMGEHQTYNCNECDVRSCHGCIGEDNPSCPSCGVVFEHTMGPFDDDGNYIGNAEEAVYIKGKNSKEPKQEAMFYQVGQEDLGGFIPEKIVPIRTMNERGRNKIVNAMKGADTIGSPSPSGPSEEPEPAEATGSEPSNENFSAEFGLVKNKEYICSNDGKKYQRYKLAQNPRAYEGIMMPVCWGCGGSLIQSRRPGEDWRVAHTSRNYVEPTNANFSAESENCPKCDSNNLGKGEMYYCYTCGNDDALEDGCSKCGSANVGEEEYNYCYSCGLLFSTIGHWFDAESAFDRLEDEVAEEYEEKGMSDKKAQKIGAAVAYTQGVKKYGKKVMTEAAKKGVSAKSLTKNAESLVEEPDWIPDGDGRAFGQQNSAINLSPLHAESQRDSFRAKSNVITIWGVDYDTRIDEYNNTIIEDCGTSILAELEVKTRFDEDYEGLYDRDNEFVYVDYDKNTQECTFSTTDFDVIVDLIDDNHVAIEEIGYEALGRKRWKAESQESMILEACGICDKDFASETLNADGYCGSCCDSRLAEFDNRIDFSAETDDEPYYCMDCDDRQKLPVEEMCPKCLTEGQFYCWECCSRNEGDAHFSAESKGISKNAQIALGLTALGVGIAVWKSNDILNLFNKFRGE